MCSPHQDIRNTTIHISCQAWATMECTLPHRLGLLKVFTQKMCIAMEISICGNMEVDTVCTQGGSKQGFKDK